MPYRFTVAECPKIMVVDAVVKFGLAYGVGVTVAVIVIVNVCDTVDVCVTVGVADQQNCW